MSSNPRIEAIPVEIARPELHIQRFLASLAPYAQEHAKDGQTNFQAELCRQREDGTEGKADTVEKQSRTGGEKEAALGDEPPIWARKFALEHGKDVSAWWGSYKRRKLRIGDAERRNGEMEPTARESTPALAPRGVAGKPLDTGGKENGSTGEDHKYGRRLERRLRRREKAAIVNPKPVAAELLSKRMHSPTSPEDEAKASKKTKRAVRGMEIMAKYKAENINPSLERITLEPRMRRGLLSHSKTSKDAYRPENPYKVATGPGLLSKVTERPAVFQTRPHHYTLQKPLHPSPYRPQFSEKMNWSLSRVNPNDAIDKNATPPRRETESTSDLAPVLLDRVRQGIAVEEKLASELSPATGQKDNVPGTGHIRSLVRPIQLSPRQSSAPVDRTYPPTFAKPLPSPDRARPVYPRLPLRPRKIFGVPNQSRLAPKTTFGGPNSRPPYPPVEDMMSKAETRATDHRGGGIDYSRPAGVFSAPKPLTLALRSEILRPVSPDVGFRRVGAPACDLPPSIERLHAASEAPFAPIQAPPSTIAFAVPPPVVLEGSPAREATSALSISDLPMRRLSPHSTGDIVWPLIRFSSGGFSPQSRLAPHHPGPLYSLSSSEQIPPIQPWPALQYAHRPESRFSSPSPALSPARRSLFDPIIPLDIERWSLGASSDVPASPILDLLPPSSPLSLLMNAEIPSSCLINSPPPLHMDDLRAKYPADDSQHSPRLSHNNRPDLSVSPTAADIQRLWRQSTYR
ncbi:hypothetical protein P7C73_g1253, partial [Tremellales sp. Uapishka_1]